MNLSAGLVFLSLILCLPLPAVAESFGECATTCTEKEADCKGGCGEKSGLACQVKCGAASDTCDEKCLEADRAKAKARTKAAPQAETKP